MQAAWRQAERVGVLFYSLWMILRLSVERDIEAVISAIEERRYAHAPKPEWVEDPDDTEFDPVAWSRWARRQN